MDLKHRNVLLDLKGMTVLLGVCKATVLRWKAQKKLPPPIVDDKGKSYWNRDQVLGWAGVGCEKRMKWGKRIKTDENVTNRNIGENH